MSVSWTKFNTFTLNLLSKVHNLSADSIKVALVAAANTPVVTNTVLANLTEIAYTNLSSRVVTVTSLTQSSGTAKWLLANLTLTASGGAVAAWRYVVLYNDTATNKELIAFADYGSTVTMADTETFALTFDQSNGALTI